MTSLVTPERMMLAFLFAILFLLVPFLTRANDK
jgi:hypothetical protein